MSDLDEIDQFHLQRDLARQDSAQESESEPFEQDDWGNRAATYYSGGSEEEDEHEASELQKARIGRMREEDFEAEVQSEVDVEEPEFHDSLKTLLESKTQKASLENLVDKDLEAYEELLKDFGEKIEIVKVHLEPLVSKYKQVDPDQALSFLQAKYHLLLSYCTNMCFYMLLKHCGKRIEGHPVVDELSKIRVFLERIRPIEDRLEPQINRWILGDSHGPRIDSLIPAEQSGVYNPPRLAPVPFEDRSKQGRQKKREAIAKRQDQSQQVLRELQGQDTDSEQDEQIGFEEEHLIRLKKPKKDQFSNEIQSLGEIDFSAPESDFEAEHMGDEELVSSDSESLDGARKSKRPAGSTIIRNRGLVPYRTRSQRNPRVRQRKRFEKAQKKIQGLKRSYSTPKKPYTGEKSGINISVSKSTKF